MKQRKYLHTKEMGKNFQKNQKKILKFSEKKFFFFFAFFISKSRNREEFTKSNLEKESRNSGDHEF